MSPPPEDATLPSLLTLLLVFHKACDKFCSGIAFAGLSKRRLQVVFHTPIFPSKRVVLTGFSLSTKKKLDCHELLRIPRSTHDLFNLLSKNQEDGAFSEPTMLCSDYVRWL